MEPSNPVINIINFNDLLYKNNLIKRLFENQIPKSNPSLIFSIIPIKIPLLFSCKNNNSLSKIYVKVFLSKKSYFYEKNMKRVKFTKC